MNMPVLPKGRLVVPVDSSTSTVLNPGTEPQIHIGQTGLGSYQDIVYAPDLKMDILVPRTEGTKPLVVYLPGGGFVFAAKENNLNPRTFVAEAGYVVASIQYRTVPDGARYTDSVGDAKSAIRYLRAHAAEYDINPAKVAVWGDSAGGYLASMVGVTNGLPEFEVGENLDQSSEVQAVLEKFGPSDLSKVAADYDEATQEAYAPMNASMAQFVTGGTPLQDDPAAVAKANPATYVTAEHPPFLHFHGTADTLVSPSQTLLLHNALLAVGGESTRYLVEGAGHGDLAFLDDPQAALPWWTEEVMGHIVDFFGTHLK